MSEKRCEGTDCGAVEDDDTEIRTYGFTVDGLVESERDYCEDCAPSANVIDP